MQTYICMNMYSCAHVYIQLFPLPFSFFADARVALLARDYAKLGECMRANFSLRRSIYGDACLGEDNLKMVHLANELGAPAKFSVRKNPSMYN